MAKSFKIIILTFILTFPFLLQAQYLYYSDGSLFPLSISNNRLTVKFKQNVPVSQKVNYLKNLSQIDKGREKRGLPSNFVGLPLKTNVNVSRLIQSLKNSDLFENRE